MKKNTTKAFTLVEMLIVIVIIGILIASLMPRMQSAQGRARDVARKNDLAQIQTAIITSQQDRGSFPGMPGNTGTDTAGNTTGGATNGIIVDAIAVNLQTAGMSSVPSDPNGSNVNYGLGGSFDHTFGAGDDTTKSDGKYIYLVAKRNGVDNAGFALMAKTEVEGGSNWVVCQNDNTSDTSGGYITTDDDLAKLKLCKTVTQSDSQCLSDAEDCFYKDTAELRYLLLY